MARRAAASQRYAVTVSPLLKGNGATFGAAVYKTGTDRTWNLERVWLCQHRHRRLPQARSCGERFISRIASGKCLHHCHMLNAYCLEQHCRDCQRVPYRLVGGVRV